MNPQDSSDIATAARQDVINSLSVMGEYLLGSEQHNQSFDTFLGNWSRPIVGDSHRLSFLEIAVMGHRISAEQLTSCFDSVIGMWHAGTHLLNSMADKQMAVL